jgi:chromodomain-helicase-DNA-binding protein 7
VNDDQALQRFKRWSANPGVAKFAKKERPAPNKWVKLSKSPEYENGNLLREYQLESLNWLTFNWYHKRNTILADEMGLGKTVQAMSILHHLYTNECVLGPFLVVAPLSTIPHWKREFEGWTKMNAIVYHGSAAAREVIRKCELYHRDPSTNKVILGAPKFNVLITTYEMVLSDSKTLKPFQWRYLVVDEAHRLKNQDSKLIGELRNYRYDHVLLMTGTPLQNNTTELWSLLNFLNPDKFGSLSDFLMHYGDLTTATQVDKLHALLRPIMLRRLKEDVEKSIMPLEETIVEVELTNLQKRYYRAIYERNFAYLTQGRKGGNVPSLLNVVMQLRSKRQSWWGKKEKSLLTLVLFTRVRFFWVVFFFFFFVLIRIEIKGKLFVFLSLVCL